MTLFKSFFSSSKKWPLAASPHSLVVKRTNSRYAWSGALYAAGEPG